MDESAFGKSCIRPLGALGDGGSPFHSCGGSLFLVLTGVGNPSIAAFFLGLHPSATNIGGMDWARKCAVIIPCFDEAGTIADVVRDARKYVPTVIVVDDGSTDATAIRAREAEAVVIQLGANHGKGAALRMGCEEAAKRDFAWVLLMDGDGQHAAADFPKFLACVEEKGADLVVGNRFEQAAGIPAVRRFVNRWMTRRLSDLTGRDLLDSQCGFRLVRLEAWARASLRTSGFEIESEMLVNFLAAGFSVEFVPIQVIYKQRSSKIHPFKDSWKWWRWWRSVN
jgi:glycosyltransferase involved in cell wall biosynthesis